MFLRLSLATFLCVSCVVASGCDGAGNSVTSKVPVLSTIESLGGLLGDVKEIQQTVENLPDDVSRTANNLEANLQRLIDKLSAEYKDNVDLTFDKLNETEKRFFEDTENTVSQLEKLIGSANGAVNETRMKSLGDADILLYNTSERFLFRNKKPRVVYSWPEEIVRGKDVPEVTLNGNFLNEGLKSLSVGGVKVEAISKRGNQVKIPLPARVLDSLNQARSLPIKLTYSYKGKKFETSSSCLVKPQVSYRVKVTIHPTAELPEYKKFTFTKDHGKVDHTASVNRSVTHTLPTGYVVESWTYKKLSENGKGKGITGISQSGKNAVLVKAHIQGKGVRTVLGVVVDYLGRGWLKYKVDVKGKRLVQKALTTSTHESQTASSDQFEFTFKHDKAVPSNAVGVKWDYDIEVEVTNASGKKEIVQLSNVNPNSTLGYASRIENGKLAVSIPAT